jgi:hypothetical protein
LGGWVCKDCSGGDGDGVYRVEVWRLVEGIWAIGWRVIGGGLCNFVNFRVWVLKKNWRDGGGGMWDVCNGERVEDSDKGID